MATFFTFTPIRPYTLRVSADPSKFVWLRTSFDFGPSVGAGVWREIGLQKAKENYVHR